MNKVSVICVLVILLAWEGNGVPQGRRVRQPQPVHHEHQLDPTAVEEEMNTEHTKLIENLQRLKRTLDTVKDRVGKGSYGDAAKTEIKTPESAILTVLKSLEEQGQLFSMINDMLKAGSEVQNQTAKIQAYAKLEEEAKAEAVAAENTNQLTPAPVSASPRSSSHTTKDDMMDPGKQHGYDDYQYQYRDDTKDTSGDDQYEYQYDGSGYEEAPKSGSSKATTTTTTTTTIRPKRTRSRGRNEYY